jgi:NMD protein affecting ribosome stability and mRNA decay
MRKNVEKFGISDKRGREKTSQDPFVYDKGLKDPSLCKNCFNFFHNNRWEHDPRRYKELKESADVNWVLCPSCRKTKEGYVEGFLTLAGAYLWEHEEEIRQLLDNEAARIFSRNPLERVIRTVREEDRLIVETTGQKLAEHLGKALHRAHQGEFKVQWDGCPEVCRVSWERME